MSAVETLTRLCKQNGVKHVVVQVPHEEMLGYVGEIKVFLSKNKTVHSITYADGTKEVVNKMLMHDLQKLIDEKLISSDVLDLLKEKQ